MIKHKNKSDIKLELSIFNLLAVFALGFLVAAIISGQAVNKNNKSILKLIGVNINSMPVESSLQTEELEMSPQTLKGLYGQNFDREFIAHMIHHHTDAVESAKIVSQNSQRVELKKFADEMAVKQQEEVDQLKKWQKDWRLVDPNAGAHYH